MPRAPCGGLPSGAIFNTFQGGGCSTGPHVPSNPTLDLNDPRAKGKTHGGSAPLVMGPQAGPYSIHFRGGRGAVRAPMCPLTPCMTPLHHVPRTRQTEGARPLSWAPKRGHIQSIPGGEGSNTGPHVPSNPMHDPNDPRAKGKTHGGSAPLVMGPQAGPCSIQFRGGMGAVRAPMCHRPLSWAPVVQGSEFDPRESMRHPLLAQTRGWANIECPWTMGLVSLACISMDAGWEFDYLGWLERRGGLGVAMIGS